MPPWHVGEKTKKGWPIKRADTGEVVGYSDTLGKAQASVRARYSAMQGKETFNEKKKPISK